MYNLEGKVALVTGAGGKQGNQGYNAAVTAIEMANLVRTLDNA